MSIKKLKRILGVVGFFFSHQIHDKPCVLILLLQNHSQRRHHLQTYMVDISELKLCSGAELLIAKKDKSYVFFCCSHHNFTTGIQTAPVNEN